MSATIDPSKQSDFGPHLMTVMNHAALAIMASLGHRTGLFDAMARLPAATSHRIAEQAGLNERYVREWLGAMVTSGVVEYNASEKAYHLPPEHAAWLTRDASPNNLAGSMQWVALMGCVEDDVLAAFKHGQGVPYSAYHRFHEVMAEESAQTVVAGLSQHILPLVDGLIDRLTAGIDVLDVGCGSGQALIHLARQFPQSRFIGYDFSEEGVQRARQEAARQQAANARFDVVDAAAMPDTGRFDLVTAFDAIHDQARPGAVLANIRRALKPSGVFLMQDISGSSNVEEDINHPLGPFLYSISCMHCMSVSLAHGGPGLGAMWGKELALQMLREAGFQDIRVEALPHDIMNYYYIAQ